MLSFKSEASDSFTLHTSSYSGTQEFKNWERLVFAFDMDREPPPNSRNTHGSRSNSSANNRTGPSPISGGRISEYSASTFRVPTSATSIPSDAQDSALLAQFAAAAAGNVDEAYPNMMVHESYPSLDHPPGFYGNFLPHRSMPNPQLPPLSTPDFPWQSLPPHQPQAGPSHYASNPAMSRPSAFLGTPFPPTAPVTTNRWGQQMQPASSSHTASSPEVEQTEAERNDISDEKRRRNTAASGESSVVI